MRYDVFFRFTVVTIFKMPSRLNGIDTGLHLFILRQFYAVIKFIP